jgi:hypothetical protein
MDFYAYGRAAGTWGIASEAKQTHRPALRLSRTLRVLAMTGRLVTLTLPFLMT